MEKVKKPNYHILKNEINKFEWNLIFVDLSFPDFQNIFIQFANFQGIYYFFLFYKKLFFS